MINYLFLVASNKQQIQWTRIWKKHKNIGSLKTNQERIRPSTEYLSP